MIGILAVFITPVILSKTQQMLLLLPLCLTVAVVYKTTKCAELREIPVASVVSFISIVVGMYAVGIALLLVYHWAA
jgi:hypothetical protein